MTAKDRTMADKKRCPHGTPVHMGCVLCLSDAIGNYSGRGMKIKKEHFDHMRDAMAATLKASGRSLDDCREYLKSDACVGDLEKRLRWDLLHAAKLTPWICDNLYSYLNDTHIDTALRAIIAELAPKGKE